MHLQLMLDLIREGSPKSPIMKKSFGVQEMDLQKTLFKIQRLLEDGFVPKIYGLKCIKRLLYGKTDVAIAYIQGAASEENLDFIRERLDEIYHDGLTMTDKSLEEFLFKQRFHPMPFVRFTERPDICAAHLLEGHIAIMVDTSPSVIFVPVTLFHHLQHAEEYRQAPLIGTFVRLIRFFGAMLSLVLLPFWYLLATKQHYLPDFLSYIGPKDIGEIPLLIQLLLQMSELKCYEWLQSIHPPRCLLPWD